jgi:NADH:ubiquinone oxidoreductase subunit E
MRVLQEKVEEDLYIRQQEMKFYERKREQAQHEMAEKELQYFRDTIAPAMAQAQELLKASGDTVSDAGLEAVARWKLGQSK